MEQLKKTPLHVRHLELGARMAPFAGFDMPLSYDEKTGGSLKEHMAVRQHVGIFDVSHMGEFWVTGRQATDFLNFVCTRSFNKVMPFKAQYCLLLNDKGTIEDDIIVYKIHDQKYWVVVNASNMEKDFALISTATNQFDVTLKNVSEETALIALQGPKAVDLIKQINPTALSLKYYHFLEEPNGRIIARTGYTGEDGFEIFLPESKALELWKFFEERDAVPIGLGARDTLRLEVGFPLYGHELSDSLYPHETFSAFAVEKGGSFRGSKGLSLSPRFLPVAVKGTNPKPIRAHDRLILNGQFVGDWRLLAARFCSRFARRYQS
jgi:aminomethyltransferase